jgi:multidrug efflux pump subunit AcrA (membrane-fusion protein)
MTNRTRASWLVYALGALCAGAIVAAVLLVGPPSTSQATVTRTATVATGVVQSTVSGSGNLQALSQLNLGFKTGGTVTHIYVAQGQQVTQGELLATLDPQSAEVTLEQAKASLQSAEANLAKEEETDGESSTGATGTGATGGAAASSASVRYPAGSQATDVAYVVPTGTTDTPASTTPATTTPATTTPTSTTPTSTTPTASTPATTNAPSTTPASATTKTTTSPTSTTPSTGTTTAREHESKESSSGSTAAKATISTATREANLASARAAVKSDKLTVQSDEQAVQDTNLYAPENGTIVSLSGQVGEVVSGSGTTRSSSSSSSSGATGASATGATGRSSTATSGSSASTGSSSSSSAFAVLSDLSTLQLVVPLSESEIGSVKAGQIATVTVEALSGAKLAAHVSEVALLSTSSSGAVSYDVTFQLDQLAGGIKLGMSATAEVVVKQAQGINVPTSAITADSVTVERGGKQVRQRVVTGLAGNTSTIVLSGLKGGETIVLPAASTTSSSTNIISKLGSRLGGGGLSGAGGIGAGGLGGGGGGGGGGAAFFRGGG